MLLEPTNNFLGLFFCSGFERGQLMKKPLVTVLVIGACFYFVKMSPMFSYSSTLWSQVKTQTKNAVPTRLESDRARHEIANLDDDIGGMIRPIAEYKATI